MKDEQTKQIEEFKKVIESCHVNFLIGSGTSMPFLETLGNVERNITYIDNHSVEIGENLDLLKCSIYWEYLNKCILGNLFFLDRNTKYYVQKCEEFQQGIADKFISVKNEYERLVRNINQIISARDLQLLSKQVNIFTTNVDVFLDSALESLSCNYNDGFSGKKEVIYSTDNFYQIPIKISPHYEFKSEQPNINLFKIHGSVNWEKGEEIGTEYKIKADYNLSSLQEIYNFCIENESKFVNYHKIDAACTHKDIEALKLLKGDKSFVDEFKKQYENIVMINPTKQKFRDTTTKVHYYELLRIYSNHLERPNSVLFVLGFSFADEHIDKITQRVASSNPTLLIYVLSSKSEYKDFEDKFIKYPNIRVLSAEREYYTLADFNLQLEMVIQELPKNSKYGK